MNVAEGAMKSLILPFNIESFQTKTLANMVRSLSIADVRGLSGPRHLAKKQSKSAAGTLYPARSL